MGVSVSFKAVSSRILLITGVMVSGLPIVSNPLHAQQSPLSHIAALCDSGFVLLEQENYESARFVFRNALRLDRNHIDALLGMGLTVLAQPGGEARALTYLERAVEQAPEHQEIRYLKAYTHAHLPKNVLFNRNAGNKALEEIEVLLSLNPSHGDAWYLQGQVYRDWFQDSEKAMESFRTQIEVNPEHAAANVEYLKAAADAGHVTIEIVGHDGDHRTPGPADHPGQRRRAALRRVRAVGAGGDDNPGQDQEYRTRKFFKLSVTGDHV